MIGPHQRGYTLVEITIVTAVITTISTLALPTFNDVIERQRVSSVLHSLSAHLANARNTAITRGTSISVCPSADGESCTGHYDWSEGWITYRDGNKLGKPETTDSILQYENAATRAPMQLLSSAGRRAIRFSADGRSAGSNLRIKVCNRGQVLGEVIVNNLGRIRTSRPSSYMPC